MEQYVSADQYVKKVSAENLHGRFNLEQEFTPDINVLHGRNGTGKTTLLHVLANALNGDFSRFAFLTFSYLRIETANGDGSPYRTVELSRSREEQDHQIVVKVDGEVRHSFSVESTRNAELESARESRPRRRQQQSPEIDGILSTAYFPAFRTMIEAWSNSQDLDRYAWRIADDSPDYRVVRPRSSIPDSMQTTLLARRIFDHFVPRLSYPSPSEIQDRIASEYQRAMLEIGRTDRALLSKVFLDVIGALFEKPEGKQESLQQIGQQVSSLLDELESLEYPLKGGTGLGVYNQLKNRLSGFEDTPEEERKLIGRVLEIYQSSLRQLIHVQKTSFEDINTYLRSVNSFLEGKELVLSPDESGRRPVVQVRFGDGSETTISALSSGERQIVTQVYATTHMNLQRVVLIDEPEISLHVDWQRHLLKGMSEQLGNRQVIVCTHSPSIGADHVDRMTELRLRSSSSPLMQSDEFADGETSDGDFLDERD